MNKCELAGMERFSKPNVKKLCQLVKINMVRLNRTLVGYIALLTPESFGGVGVTRPSMLLRY